MRQNSHDLLKRVDLAQPLSRVLRDVARHYQLGRLLSSRIIIQGYDDLNVLLNCERGKYVAKLFNKTKSLSVVQDHIRVQQALTQRQAPVPRILAASAEAIYRAPGQTRDTFVCVSEYFAGENFVRRPPCRDDMVTIARFLATLHTLPFQVGHTHDSWGTLNLPYEFARKRAYVSEETGGLVAPLAEAVVGLKFGRARRRIIHGDLQRKHALKNSGGHYSVLDFGCVDYNYPIVDLGVFLALFCLLDAQPAETQGVIRDVLDAYLALAPLPARHIELLGELIRATWASYLLTADFLMRQGDRTLQTRQWYHCALRSLRAFEGIL
ncbi:MAG TPA: phosphotransferase [Ktedonobacterales bacterium]|nr:phosphotransferase [Ktedonobacterales bacterium]